MLNVRGVKELKGFELIVLAQGESKTISFTLGDKELRFYDNDGERLVEKGDFNVFVGGSSATTYSKTF